MHDKEGGVEEDDAIARLGFAAHLFYDSIFVFTFCVDVGLICYLL